MKSFALMPNTVRDKDYKYTKELINIIGKRANVFMSKEHADVGMDVQYVSEDELFSKADALIALGGDGTILSAAAQVSRHDVPVLGINLGHLGFLAEIEPSNIKCAAESLLSGNYRIENRAMIRADVCRNGKIISSFHALNDIVVSRASLSRMLPLRTTIDSHLLDTFVADGVILSTPTGSTAYSLSAGGPIIDPSLETMLITPVCPHTRHARPMVVPLDCKLTVELDDNHNNEGALLSADGEYGIELSSGDIVYATKSRHMTKLIKITSTTFYDTIRQKLNERGISK